jgi:hypothetical protein
MDRSGQRHRRFGGPAILADPSRYNQLRSRCNALALRLPKRLVDMHDDGERLGPAA